MIFEQVDKFFSSIQNYWTFNDILIAAIAIFLFTIVCVVLSTSHAYEAKLIKAVDMFNNYFIDNPQINEDNLVAFNAKMKTRKVPKQLRKQWQQFVLYREAKASHYMSFETCVSTPIKNSTFKRDVVTMNIISYILAVASFLLNLYVSHESYIDLILRHALLAPIIVLVLNYLVTIFLDLRHNAIVSDLYQNYQYFEVNIDKATQTLPEYVDYEVLFDKNEIKRGIPILYAYLQKRAEEEQRELERARLKNVEHEKFNFDEAGIESSLVLERAMQEAENYIAERKRYMEDMQKINNDISQEEVNFREITKEYQRQMQVSKESFDNYKAQLNEVSSTIEANYLKKQQQQELDRQRNLERDYDTSTDRHKKLIENYQAELKTIENFIADARKTLEKGMMSEFETYSNKVYDKANAVVEERQQEKVNNLKKQVQQLEERLIAKDSELQDIYNQNQSLNERYAEQETVFQQKLEENAQVLNRVSDEINKYNSNRYGQPAPAEPVYEEQHTEPVYQKPVQEDYNFNYQEPETFADNNSDENYTQPQEFEEEYPQEEPTVVENKDTYPTETPVDTASSLGYTFNYLDEEQEENLEKSTPLEEEFNFNYLEEQDEDEDKDTAQLEEQINEQTEAEAEQFEVPTKPEEDDDEDEDFEINEDLEDDDLFDDFDNLTYDAFDEDEEIAEGDNTAEVISTEEKVESINRRGPGRPRKEKVEQPKRSVGRPRKVVTETVITEKRGPGRPRKIEQETTEQPKRSVGRPRKEESVSSPVKKRGRPRKEDSVQVTTAKRRGRPRKVEIEEVKVQKNKVGRPRKVEQTSTEQPKRSVGRPRKEESVSSPVKKRGRPRKDKIEDIDAYLKEIDDQIAKENEKIKRSRQALEQKSKLNKKRK